MNSIGCVFEKHEDYFVGFNACASTRIAYSKRSIPIFFLASGSFNRNHMRSLEVLFHFYAIITQSNQIKFKCSPPQALADQLEYELVLAPPIMREKLKWNYVY